MSVCIIAYDIREFIHLIYFLIACNLLFRVRSLNSSSLWCMLALTVACKHRIYAFLVLCLSILWAVLVSSIHSLPTPRALATITYRSAPEWEGRFVTRQQPDQVPNFCPDFEVEHYLEAAGDRFCTSYDPNSLLYISKVSSTYLSIHILIRYTMPAILCIVCKV